MKKSILFSITLIISLFMLSSFFYRQDNKDEVPVGTVIHSILPPEYFLAENKGWVLLDGRKLEDSKLSKLIKAYSEEEIDSLPNGLGTFIRNANYNNRGIDPDTLRKIGTYQKDATKLPNKDMKAKGLASDNLSNHSHSFEKRKIINAGLSAYAGQNVANSQVRNYDHQSALTANSKEKFKHYLKTNDGEHGHSVKVVVNEGGDSETRPKNISLYAYIKIN